MGWFGKLTLGTLGLLFGGPLGAIAGATWLVIAIVGVVERVILDRHRVDVADNLEARRVHTQVSVLGRTIMVFAFVLGLSFILLLLVFRSIVVPLKAIVMNLLSVGAAYGVVVAVFQLGWGASLLGFQTVDKIEAWLPRIRDLPRARKVRWSVDVDPADTF